MEEKYVVYVGTYTHENSIGTIYMIWMQKAEK